MSVATVYVNNDGYGFALYLDQYLGGMKRFPHDILRIHWRVHSVSYQTTESIRTCIICFSTSEAMDRHPPYPQTTKSRTDFRWTLSRCAISLANLPSSDRNAYQIVETARSDCVFQTSLPRIGGAKAVARSEFWATSTITTREKNIK
jgi:hypothetical protein